MGSACSNPSHVTVSSHPMTSYLRFKNLLVFSWLLVAAAAQTARIVGSPGCMKEPPVTLELGVLQARTVMRGIVPRTYLLYIPTTYGMPSDRRRPGLRFQRNEKEMYDEDFVVKQAVPLLIHMHGAATPASVFVAYTDMVRVAEEFGFVMVAPQGLYTTWNAGRCCGNSASLRVKDVEFIGDVRDNVLSELCIDTSSIFASGHSNGAMMAHRLATEKPFWFSAIGAVAGTDMWSTEVSQDPSIGVRMYHFHGTDDALVPYYGGRGCITSFLNFTSVAETEELRASRNGCTMPLKREVIWSKEDESAYCTRAVGCGSADVVVCTVVDGGHGWPGKIPAGDRLVGIDGSERSAKACTDGRLEMNIDASRLLWRLFINGSAVLNSIV